MPLIKNTKSCYGIAAIVLHWLMATLIIIMLGIGLYMTNLPISTEKLSLYGKHKEVGILVLMLALVRILWRLQNIVPSLPVQMPAWQKLAARGAHWAFYGFMFTMPMTGWLMSSAAGLSVSFFGWFTLPDLVVPSENLEMLLRTAHQWLGYGLIATLVAHVGATVQHHFINKDDILRRMLP